MSLQRANEKKTLIRGVFIFTAPNTQRVCSQNSGHQEKEMEVTLIHPHNPSQIKKLTTTEGTNSVDVLVMETRQRRGENVKKRFEDLHQSFFAIRMFEVRSLRKWYKRTINLVLSWPESTSGSRLGSSRIPPTCI